jgi:hypothetical protein
MKTIKSYLVIHDFSPLHGGSSSLFRASFFGGSSSLLSLGEVAGFGDDVVDDSSFFLCQVLLDLNSSWLDLSLFLIGFGFLVPFFLDHFLFAYVAFTMSDSREKANVSFFPAK